MKTKFTVGLFVIIGFVIAVVVILWLGMSHFLERGQLCVAYFDESVQGLSKDSPVKYQGVSVGRVYRLRVAPDFTLIEVVLEIDPGIRKINQMVAQLKNVGITGSVFIDLNRRKPGEADLSPKITFKPPYPVVATKPSEVKQFMGDVSEILNNLKTVNLEALSGKLSSMLDDFHKLAGQAEIEKVSRAILASLNHLQQIFDKAKWDSALASVEKAAQSVNNLSITADHAAREIARTAARTNRMVAADEPAVKAAISEFRSSVQDARVVLRQGDAFFKQTDGRLSALQYNLEETLDNLNQAAVSLNRFLDLIASQPSQLLMGKPAPPRSPESETAP
jgi:phospholipid/cholesterol/gamma-HCH transport system substrate-binding protein